MTDYVRADKNAETAITKFMCKNLYDKLFGDKYILADNAEAQKSGIDFVIYNNKHRPFSVDEKAQASYINRPRDTFTFEISFLDRGMNLRQGWFLKNKINPNYYELIWINRSLETRKDRLQPEHIQEVECMFIKNLDIQNYVYSKGFTDVSLSAISELMRVKLRTRDREYYDKNGIKFVLSNIYPEKPVNIIFKKDVLKYLSTSNYIVRPDNFIKLP